MSALMSALLGAFAASTVPADTPARLPAGVVVEEVDAGWAAQRAAMQTGDVIVSWSREAGPSGNPPAARGAIESPFDLAAVELHEVSRGPVTFVGRRGDAGSSWVLAAPSG